MENLPDFESKLQAADPELQEFIVALKAENLKLKKKIAKLQAEIVSLQSDIEILKEKNVQCVQHNKSIESMSEEELIKTFNILCKKSKKP